jgi:hypothetical protein
MIREFTEDEVSNFEALRVMDREDFCLVQEHYERILEEIFRSTSINDKMFDDPSFARILWQSHNLQHPHGRTKIARSANFMKSVAGFIAEGLDYKEAVRSVFLVARQIADHKTVSITTNDFHAIFGQEKEEEEEEEEEDPSLVSKRVTKNQMGDVEVEIDQLHKQLKITDECAKELNNIESNRDLYLGLL